MPTLSFKKSLLRAAVLSVLGAAASSAMAQAYRVQNNVWAEYYQYTTLQTEFMGTAYNLSSYRGFYYDNQYNIGGTGNGLPPALLLDAVVSGDPVTSPATVTISALSDTTFGQNHARASLSGFEYTTTSNSATLCTTIDGVNCVPGLPTQTQTLSTANYAYAYAQSRWEDIYQTGGNSGALLFTFNAHARLNGSTGATPGQSNLWWAETDFNGNNLAYISASYDAWSDSWGVQVYSNVTGYQSFSGNGELIFGNGVTLSDGAGNAFDGTVQVQRTYATGDVVYASSLLQASVYSNGETDAENTIRLTNIALPTGGRVLALSGADYSGIVTGGGAGGGLCTTTSCLGGGGGGGGGNPPPVPEPETYAMMLAGLVTLGWLRRRRDRA